MAGYNALQTTASQIVYTQVDKCLAAGGRLPGSKVGALTAVDGGL
jgi:hypothetical protein